MQVRLLKKSVTVSAGRPAESLEVKILKSLRFTKAEWASFASQALCQTEEGLEEIATDESLAMHRRYLAAVVLKGFRNADERVLDRILDRIIGRPDQEIISSSGEAENLRMLPSAALRERVAVIYHALNQAKGESDEP